MLLFHRQTDNVQLLPGSTPGPRARGEKPLIQHRELIIPEGREQHKTTGDRERPVTAGKDRLKKALTIQPDHDMVCDTKKQEVSV